MAAERGEELVRKRALSEGSWILPETLGVEQPGPHEGVATSSSASAPDAPAATSQGLLGQQMQKRLLRLSLSRLD